jgi:hypothetical protein
MSGEQVETLKQLASRIGISERQARHLVNSGRLEHVRIGRRTYVPQGAWARFIANNTVTACQDETKDHDYGGSRSGNAFTSLGPSTAAVASARLARLTATKLKSSSRNGCSDEDAEQAQVIPLRSS